MIECYTWILTCLVKTSYLSVKTYAHITGDMGKKQEITQFWQNP